jgi:hypothetical protein
MGGTELMKYGLVDRLPADLLDDFQIFVSRVEEPLDENKIRILWLHDLPADPANAHLANKGWENFHALVFTSNWQMQGYIERYDIPWSRCVVMQNAITPIPSHNKPTDGIIRLGYWSTPHRGLNILTAVFDKLCDKYDNIELNVWSSYKLYGWEERDTSYQPLYDFCKQHPKINYESYLSNEDLKQQLQNVHIHAYPSIWQETSCIALMEAMSAGCLCVHPNFAALYETAANWTHVYQWNEDINAHASIFYQILDGAIEDYWADGVQSRLASQSSYANVFYNWDLRAHQWESLLRSLVTLPRALPKKQEASSGFFEYKPPV